jgi:hypothetical protein
MIGYAYLDLDKNVVYKLAEYIDAENPGFFSQNSHLIIKYWRFNTDDTNSMIRMFQSLVDLAVPKTNIELFIKCIGYDMNRLKNANKV